MRKFGVAGLGLIGGSIASALKKQGYRVVGVENDPDVSAFALRNGIVDEIGGIEALRGAETVFVCVPVGRTRETVEKIAAVVGNETLVTDVASVKGEMKGVGGRFVGGHPMAGTEKSGIAAAVVLGVGRAIGEAMAVMMVSGNAPNMPGSIFESVRFLTTAVASEMSYSSGLQRQALFSIALVLYLFILLINAALNFFLKRDKEGN